MEDFFSTSKSLAIFGGSFNPVHIGHVGIATYVYEHVPFVERVCFMPNAKTYYKQTEEGVSDSDRINMLSLAVKDLPWACVSSLEVERGGFTHTIDTLRLIKELNPDLNIKFIIGADSLLYIDTWYEAEAILSMTEILVAVRQTGDDKLISKREYLLQLCPDAKITLLETPEYEVSSTKIREMIKEDKDTTGLIPDDVYAYIKEHKLYR